MNTPQRQNLPNRQRFLELSLVAVAVFVVLYVTVLAIQVHQPPSHVVRKLEDLRTIDAAYSQYSLETSHPTPTPVPAAPARKDGSR